MTRIAVCARQRKRPPSNEHEVRWLCCTSELWGILIRMSKRPRGGRGTNQYQVRGASKASGPSAEVASALKAASDAELRAAADPGCFLGNEDVRLGLARDGRPEDLVFLVSDDLWEVREAVAKHGRPQDLDVLIADENGAVSVAVAECGSPEDLDVLIACLLYTSPSPRD